MTRIWNQAEFCTQRGAHFLFQASDAIGNAREEDPMDPPDWAPYSKSKAEAEKVALAANDPARFEGERTERLAVPLRSFRS